MEPTEPKTKKAAKGKSKGKNGDQEGSGGETEDQSPRVGNDEARGAAEVLAGGSGSGTNHQPEHERRDSTTYPLPQPRFSPIMQAASRPSTSSTTAPSYGSPAQSYSLPIQQLSPRLQQQNPGYPPQSQPQSQHNPQPIPYLVNHPHASVSYQHPPAPAYAPQFPPSYHNFPQNPAPYGSYYPSQYQHPHLPHNNAFSMTLPPSTTQPYPVSQNQNQNQRTSLSGPSQCPTPPSSHLRASTVPTPAPPAPAQISPNPSIYPALIPPPSMANLKTSSTPPSTTSDFLSNMSIFPTPSPEDEQFFLDTFCGLDGSGGGGGGIPDAYLMQSLYPDFNSLPSEAELKAVTDKLEAREREEEEDKQRMMKRKRDREYKEFCIGLMKGVRGIEGLIAKKRRRDLEEEEEEGGGGGKRKKQCSSSASAKKRKESEDETVAFLAAAALANSAPQAQKEEECCDGIIDCGQGEEEEKDKECCEGILDCGPPSTTTTATTKPTKETVEECCSGLISCDTTNPSETSTKLASSSPLKPTPTLPTQTTIYLPRSSTSSAASDSCCGPNASCSLPTPSPLSDAYILVTLAFSQLVPFMSTTPANPLLPALTPNRIAEMLHNDTRGGRKEQEETANLVIVPPGKEEEARGKKGELYVRRDVVEGVRDWCKKATGQGQEETR